MYKFFRIISHLAGIIGCIVAIFILCNEYPSNDVKFDYIGVIIGILSILVTILVTWNIYSALGIERKNREALSEQKQHNKELKADFDRFKREVYSEIESTKSLVSSQVDQQIKQRLKSSENAYISLFNTTQAQVAAAINDIDYFQQYTYYQTALLALLQCDNFPSDIRININVMLAEMDALLNLIPINDSEIDKRMIILHDNDKREFIQNMEEICKSSREEFSFEDRQKFMDIAARAKIVFEKALGK